jgi:cell division protein FtsI (penicillin-binding protein 3)
MRFEKRTPELRLRLEGWRARVVLVLVTGGFVVLAGRAFYLQGMNNDFLQQKGEARYGRVVEMPASRGPVKDRQGHPLAVSTPVESIWAVPEDFDADEAKLRALARALAMSPEEIRQKVAQKDKQFAWLKRQISPEQAVKVMALGVPGVFQQREYRRFYPAGEVMAHVVGFTGIDNSGQEGIELAQQQWLAGAPGSRKVIKDRKGRIVEDVAGLKVPRDGRELVLSIDQRLQFLAHRELKAAVEGNRAKGGSIVVLDARTGEVLALVNQPDYNPNNRANVTGSQTRNRSVTDIFEPGSTMKPFTVAVALEKGIVTPDTVINAGGPFTIGGWAISDAHPHGALTVAQVIQKSSNIGTARIQLQMSADDVGGFYRELGFGATPQTGFPGEAKGLLRPSAKWKPIEQATMAYGHGISVSLLQLARAYTIFTGEGHLLPISLVKRDALPIGKPLVSRATAHEVSKMLEMAVGPGGTAPRAAVPGYRVGGKTGTAHKPEAGGYAAHKYVSSFVGFGPVSNPRFVIAVMIDEPSGGKYYGGEVSAPVFASVMGAALRMMSVPPDAPQTLNVQAPARPAAQVRAPAPGGEG